MRRPGGIVRRIAFGVALLGMILVVIAAVVVIASQTPWVRQWLAGVIEAQASKHLRGDLVVGRVGGNLLTGIELHNVALVRDGRDVLTAQAIEVEYQPWHLLAGDVALGAVTVTQPVVHLRRTEDGRLNLAEWLEPRPGRSASGPSPLLAIDAIDVRDGTLTIGERVDNFAAVNLPDRLTDIDARLAISRPSDSGSLSVKVAHLSLRASDPDLEITKLAGNVTVGQSRLSLEDASLMTPGSQLSLEGTIGLDRPHLLDLDARSTHLSLAEAARLVPALGSRTLSPAFTVSVTGTPVELDVDLEVSTTEGNVEAVLTVDATSPQRAIEGTFSVSDLDLAVVHEVFEPSDITATGRVDLVFQPDRGVSGSYEIDASELTYGRYRAADVSAEGRGDRRSIVLHGQARAYGGRIRADGTITLPGDEVAVAYDLRGGVAGVDLEEASRELNLPAVHAALSADASGAPATFDFHVAGGPGGVETDLRLSKLSLAGATFSEGTTVTIGRRSGRLTYAIDGRVSNLDLSALGARAGIPALTSPRFASAIDAVVDLEGSGTSLAGLTLSGTATLTDSRLAGGTLPRLDVRTDIVRGTGTISLEGRFAGVDAAIVAGSPAVEGRLSGTIDFDATLADLGAGDFWSDGVRAAAGRVVLSSSALGEIPIDTAVLAGRYEDDVVTLQTADMKGPDLEVRLSGRLALDREHASDLTYFIDTPPLGQVAFVDAPVHGEVVLDGRLTGNLEAFHTTGTLSGVDVGYANVSALGVHSTYTITLPNLSLTGVSGSADSELTSVRAAGRTLTAVKASTTYHGGLVGVEASVREAGRQLDAGGRLLWHADHQEVHLDRLRLRTGTAEWRLADNTNAAIQYGGERLAIEGLVLHGGGDGRISLDGAIGPDAARPLQLEVSGLDLAEVDRLLLAEHGLAGQLDGAAQIAGSLAAPAIGGRFALSRGAFEAFTFDTFSGRFDYGHNSVGVDARLVTADGSWLTTEGRIPIGEGGGAIDLRLKSSPIGLGMIQGFTDEVTDVTGTLQLDLVATGSYDDPHLQGYADVAGGAFTAVAAGSRYTGLDTRIRFEPDLVRIEEFRMLDDDGDEMTIGGELALHERQIGGLQIRIRSRDFEAMDNALGEIEVDTDLRITGEPIRPRFEGRVELASGTVRVDRILELGDTAYEAHDVPLRPAASPDAGRFALASDVQLIVPDNLVLKGTDIQPPGGSVPTGLGDVNVTIGGDLRVRKDPDEPFELLGDVQPIRGTYEFQGRQFEIQREGAIVFTGAPDINPTLDLVATRLISGVEARVHVMGTFDAPRLELSSQPPLDDADILSLIVFNRPLNQLGAGEQISLGQRAASVAAGFVGSQIADTIGDALELDVFDVEVGGAMAPSVVVGEQFARGVFLKFRQQFGQGLASSFLLEYALTDWLRLRSEVSASQPATRSLFDRSERGAVKLVFTFRR